MVSNSPAFIAPLDRNRWHLWEALTWPQHLSDSHVHPGALDVFGAHGPVILSYRLQHAALLQGRGRTQVFQKSRTLLRCRDDARDGVVKQPAWPRHHHHIPAVNEHGSGGVLFARAAQEENGRLSKAVQIQQRWEISQDLVTWPSRTNKDSSFSHLSDSRGQEWSSSDSSTWIPRDESDR